VVVVLERVPVVLVVPVVEAKCGSLVGDKASYKLFIY
jgi:hypothetical protein